MHQIKKMSENCNRNQRRDLSVMSQTVTYFSVCFIYGAIHKGRPHKIMKNWPSFPFVCKMSALAQPLSSPGPCGHNINFEKSNVFCTKKCEHSIWRTEEPLLNVWLDNPPPYWITSPDYGHPLWTAPNHICALMYVLYRLNSITTLEKHS